MTSLSVLHIDTALEWRGGQQQLVYLAEGMVARGHRVRVATPPASALAARLDPVVEQVAIGAGWSPQTAWRLRGLARAGGVDVFACHTAPAHSLLALLSLPAVVHRRVDFVVGGNAWSRWKYQRALHFVAVSAGVSRVLSAGGVAERAIDVVFDGVPLLATKRPAPDLVRERPLVGAVGALVDHKAHHLLVSAMVNLPGVDCVIVGEGPLRGALESQIASLELSDRVQLLGYRDDIAAVVGALDLFVHPSIEEGMGQVVVEAMGLGCPVLVSTAGGLPEVVGETSTPFLAGDVRSLTDAIAERLGVRGDVAEARLRAQTCFSVDRMVERTVEVYRRLGGV